MEITATELHRNPTDALRKAHKLGSVVITLRGKPVAKLTPLQPENWAWSNHHPDMTLRKGREDMHDHGA